MQKIHTHTHTHTGGCYTESLHRSGKSDRHQDAQRAYEESSKQAKCGRSSAQTQEHTERTVGHVHAHSFVDRRRVRANSADCGQFCRCVAYSESCCDNARSLAGPSWAADPRGTHRQRTLGHVHGLGPNTRAQFCQCVAC